MVRKITLSALFCLTVFSSLIAQERNCATMESLDKNIKNNPGIAQRMAEIENITQQRIKNKSQNRIDGNIITIPVVVHVLHRNSTENISEAQILSQIDVLNEDFRRLNSDVDNTWSQAADIEVQFCMATIDPNGNATNGITRKSVTRRDWGIDDDMKRASTGGVDAWDTTQYLNMWTVPLMINPSNGGTILGYAQFPGGGDAETDGVVMGYNFFGRTGAVSEPFNLGRTTTHEVGHFFNLRHIWGDGGCGVDDFVSDTPASDGPNFGCTPNHVSCGTTDMVQNYMDYSDDSCLNLFTQGQKDRMRAVLAPGGFRRSLALSDKCGGGSTEPTCDDGVQNGDETGVDCGGSCEPCDTSSICTGEVTSYPYSEGFENSLGLWTQDTGDNINWTRDSNGTPSSSTGPSTGAEGNFYMYTEASGNGTGYPNKRAILNSPCFDLSSESQATFNFSYHMYGSNMGSLALEASTDNGLNWNVLWSESGNNGNSWSSQSIDLSAYIGGNVKLRFNGVTGNSYRSDMAIDDISLTTGTIMDCSNIELSFTFDNYPEETSWEILDSNEVVVFSGGTYGDQADGSTINLTGCIDNGCYTLVVNDAFGDGICCSFGNGSYSLTNTDTGVVLASGGSFGSSDSTGFCLGGATGRQDTVEVKARVANEDSFDIKLYPSPVKGDLLNVATRASKITYRVSNMLGQEVLVGETTGKAIDVSDLSRGTYIIQIKADKNEVSKQFIRE